VVVTGAGRDFCGGADTKAIDAISTAGGSYAPDAAELPPFPADMPEGMRRNHAYPWGLSVPVIAAVNGACVGAGFVLATYADLRFVADDAKVVTAFAGLGLPAEYGLGWVLPRLIGVPNALQMLLHPDSLPAEECRDLGWAQRVVPADSLVADTVGWARQVARTCGPDAVRWIKRAVLADAAGDFAAAYTRSVQEMDEALRGPDLRAAIRARRDGRQHDFLTG
jgi:enoyl-CoA hydratase/carnithine racemase